MLTDVFIEVSGNVELLISDLNNRGFIPEKNPSVKQKLNFFKCCLRNISSHKLQGKMFAIKNKIFCTEVVYPMPNKNKITKHVNSR